MKNGIEQDYITIGGWSMEGNEPKEIIHKRGNRYGERTVKILRSLPREASYDEARAAAQAASQETGFRVGRDFTEDEWAGKVKAQ